jgi:hypothetical protein
VVKGVFIYDMKKGGDGFYGRGYGEIMKIYELNTMSLED